MQQFAASNQVEAGPALDVVWFRNRRFLWKGDVLALQHSMYAAPRARFQLVADVLMTVTLYKC